MKRLIFILALIFSATCFAESAVKDEFEIFQGMYGKNKKDVLAQYIKVSGPQGEKFWKLYDSYEVDRKQLGQKKLKLISEYAENYAMLTNENADKIATQSLQNNMDFEKLYSKYYKKTKSVLGAVEAAKFIQLEVYFQTAVRSEIQNSIPLIGDIEKKSTETDW